MGNGGRWGGNSAGLFRARRRDGPALFRTQRFDRLLRVAPLDCPDLSPAPIWFADLRASAAGDDYAWAFCQPGFLAQAAAFQTGPDLSGPVAALFGFGPLVRV